MNLDIVANNEDMFAVYISSKLDFDPYFIRIQRNMIYIDGCVVQDECLEFEDINSISEDVIKTYLDKQGDILSGFLNNGLFLFAYSKEQSVFSVSIETDKKQLNNSEIKNIYNQNKFATSPDFGSLDKIILKDFYGNVVYCYDANRLDK